MTFVPFKGRGRVLLSVVGLIASEVAAARTVAAPCAVLNNTLCCEVPTLLQRLLALVGIG